MTDDLTDESFARIARLAQIEVSPDEAVVLKGEMKRILDFMDLLDRYKSDDDDFICQPGANRMRKDQAAPSMPCKDVVLNAPCLINKHFAVPRVTK